MLRLSTPEYRLSRADLLTRENLISSCIWKYCQTEEEQKNNIASHRKNYMYAKTPQNNHSFEMIRSAAPIEKPNTLRDDTWRPILSDCSYQMLPVGVAVFETP